jgi:hypothetical protein
MRMPARDDLLGAGLAVLAAGVHLAMAATADRFPPELDLSVLFVALPPALMVLAAAALLLAREARPLQVACLYTWLMVLYTLPAQLLGLRWVPSALLLTLALTRPRLSSGRPAAG